MKAARARLRDARAARRGLPGGLLRRVVDFAVVEGDGARHAGAGGHGADAAWAWIIWGWMGRTGAICG